MFIDGATGDNDVLLNQAYYTRVATVNIKVYFSGRRFLSIWANPMEKKSHVSSDTT